MEEEFEPSYSKKPILGQRDDHNRGGLNQLGLGPVNRIITKQRKESPTSKMCRIRCKKAKKTLAFIQENIFQYEKQLEQIRDKIANISPDKWIGELSSCTEGSDSDDFDFPDMTPIKGSVSKIERKRRIFDMIKAFNETLQKSFKLSSLRQFQIFAVQKLQSGNSIIVSEIPGCGRSLIWALMVIVRQRGYGMQNGEAVLVVTSSSKIGKRIALCNRARIRYEVINGSPGDYQAEGGFSIPASRNQPGNGKQSQGKPRLLDGDEESDHQGQPLSRDGGGSNRAPQTATQVYFLVNDKIEYATNLKAEARKRIRLVVLDSCCNSHNAYKFSPLIQGLKQTRRIKLLISGLFTKEESLRLSRLFGIPSRYCYNKRPKLRQLIKDFTISKDLDKTKAFLSFLKQHGESPELHFIKEESFKIMFPLVILSDSKKERDRLSEGLRKLGISPIHLGSDKQLEGEDQSAKKSVHTKKMMSLSDNLGTVYIGSSSRLPETFDLGIKMIVVNGFPRSIDHLLQIVRFDGAKQHLFFTDKEFLKKRNSLLSEFIEPACLLRLCKMMKRLSNVSSLRMTQEGLSSIHSSGRKSKASYDYPENKEFKVLKLRQAELNKMLNTSKAEPLCWTINKLQERGNFNLMSSCPVSLKITFTIPNHTKSTNRGIKRIISHGKFSSGKYRLDLLSMCEGVKEKTKRLLRDNRIMLDWAIVEVVTQSLRAQLQKVEELKEKGILNIEVSDELMFFKPKEGLTDVQIYQIIAERKHDETNLLQKVDLLYSILESNSLGVLEQLVKGITRTNSSGLSLEAFISQIYSSNKKSQEIFPSYESKLKIKSRFNQRERSTILKDFSDIFRAEKNHFKGLVQSLSKVGDDIRKRSILLNVLKQVYATPKQRSLKYLKTNPNLLKKYSDYDFQAVFQVLFKNFQQLKIN